MTVNRQIRSIGKQSVNGMNVLEQLQEIPNDSVNGNSKADNYERTRSEFPKPAGLFALLSKTGTPKTLKEISENVLAPFTCNSAKSGAESSETEVMLIDVVNVRKSL